MRAEYYGKGERGFKLLSGFLSLPFLCIHRHSCDSMRPLSKAGPVGLPVNKNMSKYNYFRGVWWCTAIISGLALKQEDNEFEVRLSQNK